MTEERCKKMQAAATSVTTACCSPQNIFSFDGDNICDSDRLASEKFHKVEKKFQTATHQLLKN